MRASSCFIYTFVTLCARLAEHIREYAGKPPAQQCEALHIRLQQKCTNIQNGHDELESCLEIKGVVSLLDELAKSIGRNA